MTTGPATAHHGAMPAPAVVDETLAARALAAGRAAGLDAIGVTDAEPFTDTRRHLEERRRAGLHGGMAFTYRNPARSTDPRALLPSARSLVAGARAYGAEDVPPPPDPGRPHGRVARYAWGDHYAALEAGLQAVADVLTGEGWRAVVVADQNHLVDRAVAHRAGLGWYGKNSLLLLPGSGSWFVLGTVVTDAPLAAPAATPQADVPTADAPQADVPTTDAAPVNAPPTEAPQVGALQADGCGPCTRCIEACPTGAIVAPGVIDARRCLAWIVQAPGPVPREHRVGLGDRIYGCDECQDSCPPNRVELRRHRRGEAVVDRQVGRRPDERPWVDLLTLLDRDDADLVAAHARWYIAGRDPRWLRRNALVALGNVGAPDDPAVLDRLRRAVEGDDDLLGAHAAWALRRLGRDDVLATGLAARRGAGRPAGPDLATELEAPPPPRHQEAPA